MSTATVSTDAQTPSPSTPTLSTSRAAGLASGAVVLLITLVVIAMAALVGGEFLTAIPSDSAFSGAIETLTENGRTAFTIFGVSLLAIPAVAVLTYIVMNLGGFMDLGGMTSFRRGRQ